MLTVYEDEAVRVVLACEADAPVVFSCEHASGVIPEGFELSDSDKRLLGQHWAVDLGAAELTESLVKTVGAVGILAKASRLVIDLNRPLDAPTLFRQEADGVIIDLNRDLQPDQVQDRIRRFYKSYHQEMDRWIGGMKDATVFSLHSFTPCYEGAVREIELGVLFDENPEEAEQLCAFLLKSGYVCALNEPWTGKDGLMYSPLSHAQTFGRKSLELEVRQDRLVDPEWRERFVPILVSGLRHIGFI